jgi:hypothetical protein
MTPLWERCSGRVAFKQDAPPHVTLLHCSGAVPCRQALDELPLSRSTD